MSTRADKGMRAVLIAEIAGCATSLPADPIGPRLVHALLLSESEGSGECRLRPRAQKTGAVEWVVNRQPAADIPNALAHQRRIAHKLHSQMLTAGQGACRMIE